MTVKRKLLVNACLNNLIRYLNKMTEKLIEEEYAKFEKEMKEKFPNFIPYTEREKGKLMDKLIRDGRMNMYLDCQKE